MTGRAADCPPPQGEELQHQGARCFWFSTFIELSWAHVIGQVSARGLVDRSHERMSVLSFTSVLHLRDAIRSTKGVFLVMETLGIHSLNLRICHTAGSLTGPSGGSLPPSLVLICLQPGSLCLLPPSSTSPPCTSQLSNHSSGLFFREFAFLCGFRFCSEVQLYDISLISRRFVCVNSF